MKTTHKICEYIGRTYTYGEDTKVTLETLAMPAMVAPNDPLAGTTCTKEKIWEECVKQHMRCKDTLARKQPQVSLCIDLRTV